ncbi:MAG TPA: hypothetical protein VE975_05640 [Actinomycetota bacterium]|nr:hypothetical protein [Actinomycetota bacterium]
MTPLGEGRYASWSPDGRRIVYSALGPKPSSGTDLYMARPDGSHKRRLTRGPAGDWYSTWSPSGTKIAFTRSPEGDADMAGFDVFVKDIASKTTRRLTDDNLFDGSVNWAPRACSKGGAGS